MKTIKSSRGFSLIEILVVIAIIGILSTIVFASMQQARKKSRDADRISDISQLEAALHTYAITYGRYPSSADGTCYYYNSFAANGCLKVLVTAGLFTSLPTDPLNGTYTGAPHSDQMYFYDNWCLDNNINSDQQYRLWGNGELNHGATADNWWNDKTIGATPCNDPS